MGSAGYLPRLVDPLIEDLFSTFSAIMLVGPRATGKTTTAARYARTVVRLDRENEADAFVRDPDAALAATPEPVLLDEWQIVPEVLGAVKRAVDRDHRPGRFILTGSVWSDFRGRTWPGTGRVIRIDMTTLSVRELQGDSRRPSVIDALADGRLDELRVPENAPDLVGYIDLALRGGIPLACLEPNERRRRAWLSSYVGQIVTRDIDTIDGQRDPQRLMRYLAALAANTAGVVDDKTLYEAAGIHRETAQAYERLFRDLLVLEKLPAWFSNRLKRLVRTPKRLLFDPAFAASILRVNSQGVLRSGDLIGRLVETFVAAQIRAELPVCESEPHMYHLRQMDGRREVDFVLELGGGRVIGIEVKAKAAPKPEDARHLEWLKDELGEQFVAGVVFHTGNMISELRPGIIAAPICTLWG
ncbi:ATP-binding protein [Thermoactinospora rubra]|uniref:ATP-binding protein n=1 Tax=Thermoactinospora rubra TaxID=1088767 RepID=UPI00118004E3|nr:DUF4143 domain-containing protein [Thermoactinospora rubra]